MTIVDARLLEIKEIFYRLISDDRHREEKAKRCGMGRLLSSPVSASGAVASLKEVFVHGCLSRKRTAPLGQWSA